MTKMRGLEPVVAAVLLIVVAVIGAVLIYLWFSGYITKSTSQAEQMTASERLKIEAASLTASSATLYIRNLGGDNVTLATAYILRPGTVNPLCAISSITVYKPGSDSATANTLYPGTVQKVTLNTQNCNVKSGNDYVIKLVTQKGTEFAVTVTAS
jgi:FlaG/FlaF family flagellin (archaellin)